MAAGTAAGMAAGMVDSDEGVSAADLTYAVAAVVVAMAAGASVAGAPRAAVAAGGTK